ncbi:MAG: class I SAM-dependent methyltransferase [Bacteroidota bacterium]
MEQSLHTYQQNAPAWLVTIDQNEIPSREWTNPAILHAARSLQPQSILDVGCGEGWLLRTLAAPDGNYNPPEKRVGIDGVPALIEAASKRDPAGQYLTIPYDQLSADADLGSFELIICNYSLFGKESVVELLQKLTHFISPKGYLLIQTIHDTVFPDPSRWVEEDWCAMKQNYQGGYKWYYRSLAEWNRDFEQSGWSMFRYIETSKPDGGKLSYIFMMVPRASARAGSEML